jgi:Tfp pilus assembly major pilin PilA
VDTWLAVSPVTATATMAAGPKGAGGYQQLNMSTAVDESIGIEPQDAQSGEGPGLLHPPPPLQRTTHPIIVDWLKHPEPGIAATARLFQLPSYMIEQQKGVAELMQDLVGLNKAIEQSIADEEERQATSPDARAGHLRRINRTAERLADTASALRIVQGKSIVTKKVPFDETEAKVDDDGWIRAPLTGKDEPVRKYPLCNTSVAELGSIGGVGLRLYFFIIKFLAGLCFLMGVITLRESVVVGYRTCQPACLPARVPACMAIRPVRQKHLPRVAPSSVMGCDCSCSHFVHLGRDVPHV